MGCPDLGPATQSSRSTLPVAFASAARGTRSCLGQCSGCMCRARSKPSAQTDLAKRCNSTSKEASVWFHPLSFSYSMLSSVDELLGPTEKALSAIASDNEAFFRQSSAPIFECRSLNEIVQLLITTYEAI